MNSPTTTKPELLSPAGDWDALRAAVANGADAVYFGLSHFNARHRATNFTTEELPEIMTYLHAHNVKGFVTFNTLIFSDELEEAADYTTKMAAAGVDAVIVQDLGLANLIHHLTPQLHIHGSTQMTLTEPRGIEFVRELGVERVVVARELSIDDIAKIRKQTDLELEVFIHGALCVAYSGQCLTSESLGGRSANRGQCAQACRLPYDMIVDGKQADFGDLSYLLSPQDLAAYDLVKDLSNIGVSCLKIEGRLKSSHYVAATTQTYRAAIDANSEQFTLNDQQRADLEQTFSRGFSHGFLGGVNHQELVTARFPKSRGLRIGTVDQVTSKSILIDLESHQTLKPGDGVVFDEGHPEQDEQGGRVFVVQSRGKKRIEIELGHGDVNLRAISPGAIVWKTDDPALRKRLEHTYSRDTIVRRSPLDAAVIARTGQLLTIEFTDVESNTMEVATWDKPLEKAQKHPTSEAMLREQLSRLGETPFELRDLKVELAGDPMIPKSVLNDLRRDAVSRLIAQRESGSKSSVANDNALADLRAAALAPNAGASPKPTASALGPHLYVLVRTPDQLAALLDYNGELKPSMVYCDFEDVRNYKNAVALARSKNIPIALAAIRIVKPGEEGLLQLVSDCAPDAFLVRNLSAIAFFHEVAPHVPLIGDYSLNVANELTADLFYKKGLQRIVPSYDLNWQQLGAMLKRSRPNLFETVIHQHMPMFHMEHCVFAHMLSEGKDYRDCGRPCEAHSVDLRDRVGEHHPLIPDVGCRNTVYNAQAQSAIEYVPRMLDLGLQHFRIELLRESPDAIAPLIDRYASVLLRKEDPRKTMNSLKVLHQLGVTRGTLEHE